MASATPSVLAFQAGSTCKRISPQVTVSGLVTVPGGDD
jgi:hypothetical protein